VLALRARDGDAGAFAALVEAMQPRALRFAAQMSGASRDDVDDIVQEAWIRTYRALPRYEEGRSFESWFFTILANCCRSLRVRLARWRSRSAPLDDQLRDDTLDALLATSTRHDVQRVYRALATLPTAQRETFLLHYVEGFGYDDCPAHPTWLAPVEWLGASGAATHPLHLVTNQPVDKLHSQADFGPLARAKRIGGREPIHMNPADAQARGLAHGDPVRVFNARGACLASAVPDDGVVRGAAIMATGGWYDPQDDGPDPLELRGNPNVLAPDLGTSKLAQGSSALSILVEVERWAGPVARQA
jgi:biotin/methionine sulfoxide reductase